MPRLFLQPRSPFWFTDFTTSDGLRVRKSTKETNKKKAEQVAIAFEDAEKELSSGVPPDATHTVKMIRRSVERVSGRKVELVTVEGHFKTWLARKEKGTKKATMDRYRPVSRIFLSSLGRKAQGPLSSVTPSDIQAYADLRLAQKVSPQTVRIDIKILTDAFKRALVAGEIEKNPALLVDVPDSASEEKKPFTVAEVGSLLEKARGGEWETLILLAFYTGCRLGDASRMKWENVNLEERLLSWVPEKTNRKRKAAHVVPIPEALVEHLTKLNERQKPAKSAFLSPVLSGMQVSGCKGLSLAFGVLMREAGVDTATVISKAGRKFSGKSFHSLRHTAATELYKQGVSAEDRMGILGHTTPDIHSGYTHQGEKDIRKALAKLPDPRKPARQSR